MGLDIHLEADHLLTEAIITKALESAHFDPLSLSENHLQTYFPSGMRMFVSHSDDERIRAENTAGVHFKVAMRCYFRIKGPEHPEHSGLEELHAVLAAIASLCKSKFVVSFQYESLMYWSDGTEFHVAEGWRSNKKQS